MKSIKQTLLSGAMMLALSSLVLFLPVLTFNSRNGGENMPFIVF